MQEMILVAGNDKKEVCWIRHCLREKGYSSIPCKTAKQLTQEMQILPTCGVTILLVLIDDYILNEVKNNLIQKLGRLLLDVPFIPFNGELSIHSVEKLSSICSCRKVFKQDQYPELADILIESEVELALIGE